MIPPRKYDGLIADYSGRRLSGIKGTPSTNLPGPTMLTHYRHALLSIRAIALGLLSAFLLTACASHRIEERPTAASTETNKVFLSEDPGDQMICRKEKVMGSNLRKRVCYRKRDLEAKSKLDQEEYREMSTRAVRPTVNQ